MRIASNRKPRVTPSKRESTIDQDDSEEASVEIYNQKFYFVHQTLRRNVRLVSQARSHSQKEASKQKKFRLIQQKLERKVYGFQWEKRECEANSRSYEAELSSCKRPGSPLQARLSWRRSHSPFQPTRTPKSVGEVVPVQQENEKERNLNLVLRSGRPSSPLDATLRGVGIDPFSTFPTGNLRNEEQILLKHYIDVYPEHLYGFNKDAPFNPNRDIIFPLALQNNIVWDWLMLAASSHFQLVGGQIHDQFINHRRSVIYSKLRKAVNDHERHKSDDLIIAIAGAVLVESRYGDPKNIPIHIQGMKSCLDQRGGVQSLVGKWWYPIIVQGLHIAGMGFASSASSSSENENTTQQMDYLMRILDGICFLGCSCRYESIKRPGQRPEEARRSRLDPEYVESRRIAFFPTSPLFQILDTSHITYDAASHIKQHCLLAVLLSLNIALWEYQNNPRATRHYLETLTNSIRQNGLFQRNAMDANIEMLNWILAMGNLDIEGVGGKWVDREFRRAWVVIDAMRITARLSHETRDKLQQLLFGLLSHQNVETHSALVEEGDEFIVTSSAAAGETPGCKTALQDSFKRDADLLRSIKSDIILLKYDEARIP